ncbi:MAG: cupin domain-containing protein [Verrucomicrobiota bacterium]
MNAQIKTFEAGALEGWTDFHFSIPGLPTKSKQFLKRELGLTSMEVSLNALRVGEDMPFVHKHRENEELYLFLSGSGEFQANGEVFPVKDGTCVKCSPEIRRTFRNTGEAEMVFIVIQAKDDSLLDHFTVHDGELVDELPKWSRSTSSDPPT